MVKKAGETLGGPIPIAKTVLYCVGCGHCFKISYRIIWGEIEAECRHCKKTTTVRVTPEEEDQDEIEVLARKGVGFSIDNQGDGVIDSGRRMGKKAGKGQESPASERSHNDGKGQLQAEGLSHRVQGEEEQEHRAQEGWPETQPPVTGS